MRVRVHEDAAALLAAADSLFRCDPFSTNVIAVHAARVAAGAERGRNDRLWATVEDAATSVVGVAMHTPPHALFVSRMPNEAVIALASALADADRALRGVNGARESTTAFADAWSARTGQASTVRTAMRMYRLGTLRRPRQVSGEAAVALAPSDSELVADWFAAFHAEADRHSPGEDWAAFAERRITAGEVHLWRDGGTAVALAAASTPAAGLVRIGPVYTPPPMRRKGYGAAVTGAATAAALAAGADHVALYTDLANPTSNSIYQALGYRVDHDAEERSFH
jgi:predicted GNAT family acetyltransferase